MKLIGVLHKSTTPQRVSKLKKAGLTDARIHLSKMSAETYNTLIPASVDCNLGVYIDTRGNKPTITSLSHAGQIVDRVMVQVGMRFLFTEGGIAKSPDGYEAIFELSYVPQILNGQEGKKIAIDDGNILLSLDEVHKKGGRVSGFSTTVTHIDLTQVDAIYHEGISSFEIPIHSHAKKLLTAYDLTCLKAVSDNNRKLVDFVGISFAETGAQMVEAHHSIRKMGFSKARVIAKIETKLGVQNVREIAESLIDLYGAEAEVWIARGDLTVTLGGSNDRVMEAEGQIFSSLAGLKLNVIVATNVANSLRHYKPDQELTLEETETMQYEIEQGAAGFMLAAELYAGSEQKGEDAQEVVRVVAHCLQASKIV